MFLCSRAPVRWHLFHLLALSMRICDYFVFGLLFLRLTACDHKISTRISLGY